MSQPNEESVNNAAKELNVDYNIIRKGAAVLRALNHLLRQKIIQVINDGEKMTVTEIYVKLRLEQSVASQHLAILRRAGILKTQREGKFIFYSVNIPKIEEIQDFVRKVLA